MEDQLIGAIPQPDASVVVDGKIITARAAGSAFEFGIKLIEALKGHDKAMEVLQSVCYF